jgi:hypothetical protein
MRPDYDRALQPRGAIDCTRLPTRYVSTSNRSLNVESGKESDNQRAYDCNRRDH